MGLPLNAICFIKFWVNDEGKPIYRFGNLEEFRLILPTFGWKQPCFFREIVSSQSKVFKSIIRDDKSWDHSTMDMILKLPYIAPAIRTIPSEKQIVWDLYKNSVERILANINTSLPSNSSDNINKVVLPAPILPFYADVLIGYALHP